MRKDATIDHTGAYRYRLLREWQPGWKRAVFIMLNPSTADAEVDDPTIRRCIGFAKSWGCGSIEVVNLFAFRATDPAVLRTVADPVGPENDGHVLDAIKAWPAGIIVAAWGANAEAVRPGRARRLLDQFPCTAEVHCLGTTHKGAPRHPLYVRGDQVLVPFTDPFVA